MNMAPLLISALTVAAAAAGTGREDPMPSHVVITYGINGGIAAAHVSKRIVILADEDGARVIVMEQPVGELKTIRTGRLDTHDFQALLTTLEEEGLFELPLEDPKIRGKIDFYGMDVSLRVRAGDRFWENRGPGGCIRAEAKTKPTPAERAALRGHMERAAEQAETAAMKSGTAEELDAALRAIYR